jgi:CheY-like chemotaxis protein
MKDISSRYDYDITVLLVDDDDDDQFIFISALTSINDLKINYRVASNGPDAIEMLLVDSNFAPDYIFLDMNMPLMDGRSCIKEIRKLEKKKNTPVIIHSTANLSEDAATLVETGASFYFQKPNSINKFTEILRKILSAHLVTN